MAPTLNDGDDILVDRGDGPERLRDGIYVLRLDGALVVKRLALGTDGATVRSDNPAWADLPPSRRPSWTSSAGSSGPAVGSPEPRGLNFALLPPTSAANGVRDERDEPARGA